MGDGLMGDGLMGDWPKEVGNDKGSRRRARAAGDALPMSALISRRMLLAGGVAAGLAARLPAAPASAAVFQFDEIGIAPLPHDTVAKGFQRQVLLSWGDPLFAGDAPFDHRAQSPQSAARRFGYNNDFTAFLPIAPGRSDHGLLVVNHEYPLPQLMFEGLSQDSMASNMTRAQVDITLQSLGLSVVEVRRGAEGWKAVPGSRLTRRITATTPIRISGPVAGHPALRTAADPDGTSVLGTHDNCNGGITPWGTILSGEEGSADFFGGTVEGHPAEAHLRRSHYETSRSRYGWDRFHERFDFNRHPNEPNRFEWVVELDPFDPDAPPVKRTALGRFAHEGAHTAIAPDGRLVVYLGDDWEFEYCYRFVSRDRVNLQDRAANRDLLDHGTLYVARFEADGTLEWRPLLFGDGPLTPANGFQSQADVLFETRRAADLLGATPMDSPEGYAPNPASGHVFVALTGNDRRKVGQIDAANPRARNAEGHMLELVPPANASGAVDHAADRFSWGVFLLAGDPHDPASGARYHPGTSANGWFSQPDNIGFDLAGRLWLCSDGPGARGHDGLWMIETAGPDRARPKLFYSPPVGAECCSPCFTPDGQTMFLSVQHPASDAESLAEVATRWPSGKADQPPRPSLIAIERLQSVGLRKGQE